MSDGDVDTSTTADSSFESSMVSKPPTSALSSDLSSTLQPSSSALMFNFLNYDPYCDRNSSNVTSYSSFTYFVCRSLGLGSLCMPYSFKQVGVVTGLLLSFIAGFTFTYSFTLLVRAQTFSLEPPWKVTHADPVIGPLLYFKWYKICQIHRVPTVPYQNMIEYGLAHGPKAIRCLSMFFRFTFIAMNLMLNFGKSCLYTKFASLAIQEVLKIEDRLIKPENFVRPFNLLNMSMAVMINTYIVIGLCAYLDHEEVPIVIGNSTLNRLPTDTDFFAVTTAVPSPATRSFQAIMALIGYLGNACNMLVYPYAVELCVTYALHGMSARPYVIAKDMCFVLIGLLVFACGTYAVTARLIGDAD
ncbi:hypothetical protein AGLY_012554 [Aphis glycines]|uniref:Amino acid transporter transmembrane domain-containing protein n=1 Tax=Aphis glycines TaxID=307491 RepID=A0A6G0TAT2_APHGL|nr:hypothetical protein AGLY_012554 [Aphis glycines]